MNYSIATEYASKILRFTLLLYYIITITTRLCFVEDLDVYKRNIPAVVIDYIVDAFFIGDFFISITQSSKVQPVSSTDSQAVGQRLRYRRTLQTFQIITRGSVVSKKFRWAMLGDISFYFLEILSVVPFELLGLAAGMYNFQILRLFRFIRIRHYFLYWEGVCEVLHGLQLAQTRPLQRFCMLTTTMAAVAHVGACLFYRLAINMMKNGNPKSWLAALGLAALRDDGSVEIYKSLGQRYLRAMYWAVQTLDTVGYGDIVAKSVPETYFCILFFYISGFLIYYSIANLISIVTEADSARTSTLIRKAKFAKYSVYRDLPEDLCTRIENFYDYQYETLKGVDERLILSQLPPNLSQQIHQFVIRDLLSSIEVFTDLNKGMLNALSESVESYFFNPDDVIVGANSVISGAYVVSKGEVGLVSPTGEVRQLLRARQHFGLMALKANYTTANTYLSRSFSEVFFLRGSVYRHICHLYLKPVEIEDLNQRRLAIVKTDVLQPKIDAAVSSPVRHHRISQAVRWSNADFSTNGSPRPQRTRSKISVLPEFVKSMMRPLSLPRRIWDCMMFAGLIFYMISIGLLMSASLREEFYSDMWGLLVASYIVDLIFAADALLNAKYFNFVRDGVVITQGKEITKHFLEENNLIIVALSILPIDMIVAAATSYKLLPTFRLLKMLHTRKFFPYFEHFMDFLYDKTRIPISFEVSRFITLYYFLYLLCHWAGCFWLLTADIAILVFHEQTNWIIQDRVAGAVKINRTDLYAVNYGRAIYWAASCMSSIGFPDILPTNEAEIVTITIVIFVGYLLFNTLLGAIANLISSFNRDKREFNSKVENMRGLMKFTKVPSSIEGRVLRYYEYVWSRFSGVNEKDILDSLPKSLRMEIINHIMRPLVHKIPFLANLSEPMEHMLVGLFEPRIALDGDALVVMGDIGKEMFVIERGIIEVTNENRTIVFATLGAGDYIGESCLLEMTPRTASAFAVGYVDTYFLTNDSFLQVAEKFPSEYITVVEGIQAVIAEKKQKNEAARAAKEQALKMASIMDSPDEHNLNKAVSGDATVSVTPVSPIAAVKDFKSDTTEIRTASVTDSSPSSVPFGQLYHHWMGNMWKRYTILVRSPTSAETKNSQPKPTNRNEEESSSFIHPDSQFRMMFDLLICFTLMYYAVLIPLRIALRVIKGLYAVDYLFDLLNIVDAYLYAQKFAVYRGGHMLTRPADIWRIYVKERLWIDLMAFLPYDLIVLSIVGYRSDSYVYFVRALLRIPKIFKVSILPHYYGQVERLVTYLKINYYLFKFVELTLVILVIAHWVACGWFLFGTKMHDEDCRGKPYTGGLECRFVGTWVEQQYKALKLPANGGDQWTRFIRAINYAIPTLTAETMGDMFAVNEKESTYSFLVMFCGLSINGAVVGSIVSLVSDANEQMTKMYRQLELLRDHLRRNHAPEHMIHSSSSYMTYLISEEGNYNRIQDELFAQLPHALSADIDFELKTLPYLRRCPFFDFCSDDLLRGVSSKLRMMTFAKGDKIITYGDMGHEMYFIQSGTVDVVSEDLNTTYSTLETGAFFGETALFFKSPRMASIIVRSPFCACFQLRKDDLDQVMLSADYDGDKVVASFKHLQEMNKARNRNVQKNLASAESVQSKLNKMIKAAMLDGEGKFNWILNLREKVSPESLFRCYWDTMGLVILIYYIFSIPLFIGFFSQEKLSALSQYVGLEIIFNLYWIADVFLKMLLFSYRSDPINNTLITDGDSIRKRYLSTYFWYDLIASIPTEMLILNPNIDYIAVFILRSCHLVRCPQLNEYMTAVEGHLRRMTGIVLTRSHGMMLKAGFVYVILNHWLSCVFFMIHRYAERESRYTYAVADKLANYNPVTGRHDVCATTVLECYGRSIYFVLGTMTSIGYGDITPFTNNEILWEQVVALSGAYIAAIFMGYCESYQQDKDARSDHAFKAKIRVVEQYIEYRRLPTVLKESILMQFNYSWTKTHSLNGIQNTLLENLSEPCRIDILSHLHRDIMENVPLLRDSCYQLKRRIAAKLTAQIVLADSVVYRAGDIGQSIFFVNSGELQVILSQDKSTLDAFGLGALRILLNKEEKYGRMYVRGSHFGEFCLLSKSGLRAETVRAKITSEIYYLVKFDLWEIFLYMTAEVRRSFIYQLFTCVANVRHIDRPLRPTEETMFLFDRHQRIGSLYRLACDICEDLGEILDDEDVSDSELDDDEEDNEEENNNAGQNGSDGNDDANNKTSKPNRRTHRLLGYNNRYNSYDENDNLTTAAAAASTTTTTGKKTSNHHTNGDIEHFHDDGDDFNGDETFDEAGQQHKSKIRALIRDTSMQANVAHRETLGRLEQGTPITYAARNGPSKRKNTFSAEAILSRQPLNLSNSSDNNSSTDAVAVAPSQMSNNNSIHSSRRKGAAAPTDISIDEGEEEDDDNDDEEQQALPTSHPEDTTTTTTAGDTTTSSSSSSDTPGNARKRQQTMKAAANRVKFAMLFKPQKSAKNMMQLEDADDNNDDDDSHNSLNTAVTTTTSSPTNSNKRGISATNNNNNNNNNSNNRAQQLGDAQQQKQQQEDYYQRDAYTALQTSSPTMASAKAKNNNNSINNNNNGDSSFSSPATMPQHRRSHRRSSIATAAGAGVNSYANNHNNNNNNGNSDNSSSSIAQIPRAVSSSRRLSVSNPNATRVMQELEASGGVSTNLLDLYEARGVLPAYAKERLEMLETIASAAAGGGGGASSSSSSSGAHHRSNSGYVVVPPQLRRQTATNHRQHNQATNATNATTATADDNTVELFDSPHHHHHQKTKTTSRKTYGGTDDNKKEKDDDEDDEDEDEEEEEEEDPLAPNVTPKKKHQLRNSDKDNRDNAAAATAVNTAEIKQQFSSSFLARLQGGGSSASDNTSGSGSGSRGGSGRSSPFGGVQNNPSHNTTTTTTTTTTESNNKSTTKFSAKNNSEKNKSERNSSSKVNNQVLEDIEDL